MATSKGKRTMKHRECPLDTWGDTTHKPYKTTAAVIGPVPHESVRLLFKAFKDVDVMRGTPALHQAFLELLGRLQPSLEEGEEQSPCKLLSGFADYDGDNGLKHVMFETKLKVHKNLVELLGSHYSGPEVGLQPKEVLVEEGMSFANQFYLLVLFNDIAQATYDVEDIIWDFESPKECATLTGTDRAKKMVHPIHWRYYLGIE